MRGKTALALIIAGLGLAALAIKTSVRIGGAPLPIYSTLPSFNLVDDRGEAFGLKNLTEKFAVVDFFFTRCMGPCPLMALEMLKLQKHFADRSNLHFVSITVDPKNDTPETMASYRSALGGDSLRWRFLTGDSDSIVALSEKGFSLAASTWPAEHSTKFVVVDLEGRIRGYYDSIDDSAMTKFRDDLDLLLRKEER